MIGTTRGAKNAFFRFEPFYTESYQFTKTGSGQSYEKNELKEAFFYKTGFFGSFP
jgi:hypothetical protein